MIDSCTNASKTKRISCKKGQHKGRSGASSPGAACTPKPVSLRDAGFAAPCGSAGIGFSLPVCGSVRIFDWLIDSRDRGLQELPEGATGTTGGGLRA